MEKSENKVLKALNSLSMNSLNTNSNNENDI